MVYANLTMLSTGYRTSAPGFDRRPPTADRFVLPSAVSRLRSIADRIYDRLHLDKVLGSFTVRDSLEASLMSFDSHRQHLWGHPLWVPHAGHPQGVPPAGLTGFGHSYFLRRFMAREPAKGLIPECKVESSHQEPCLRAYVSFTCHPSLVVRHSEPEAL